MALDLLPPPGEFKTTDEIRDARYADELRAKRKRLLLWSLPLMLIALLAAIKLLSAVAINMAGSSAYDNHAHNTAASRFHALEFFNVIEPWKAHFNQGTAIYASGDFFGAQQQLEVALDLVPQAGAGEQPGKEECDVRTNLSLAYEGLADEAMLAGDFAMATNYYGQAQDTLSSCGESGGNGGEEAQEAEERQEQSQSDAEQQQQEQQEQGGDGDPSQDPTDGQSSSGEPTDGQSSAGDPTDGSSSSGEPTDGSSSSSDPTESSSGDQSASPTESTDPQQEELESRNQEAQQSADADEQASGGGNGSGQNW